MMSRNNYTEVRLPNKMKIFCLRKDEVKLIYKEVQAYVKNGIELHEGDVVFDVGANIGLFTLWVYQLCNKNIKVYAFEPIPEIFDVLKANVQRFDAEKLMAFPYGLSQEAKTTTFAYYPNSTLASGLYPGLSKAELKELKQLILANLKEFPAFISWIRWLPAFLRSFLVGQKIDTAFQAQPVSCQLRTLSQIIREQALQKIDLLKVDVEKSELDVLLGVETADWQKIKQVFVEVHDLEGRIDQIKALLKHHGLTEITVEQDSVLKGSNIFSVYAVRG